MAGRFRRGFETTGVVFSVIVSISSFALSFATFYYQHIRVSEALDVMLFSPLSKSNPSVETDDVSKKIESLTIDLLFLNKGDSSVTVSDLWFNIKLDESLDGGRAWGLNPKEDELITPVLLPPMQATKVSVRCKPTKIPAAPVQVGIAFKGDPPSKPLPPPPTSKPLPPPPINPEKMSLTLEVTTIGPNYGRQQMKIPVGVLNLRDWSLTSIAYVRESYELTPIRKDPPFFTWLWNSWFD